MKKCIKCGVEKDEALYSKDKRNIDGLNLRCKDCVKKYRVSYEEKNKDKIKERIAKYKEINKNKIKEVSAKYRENNREKLKVKQEKYYANNKKKCIEATKKYRANNKDKWNEYQNKYREKNRDKVFLMQFQQHLNDMIDSHLKAKENLKENAHDKMNEFLEDNKEYIERIIKIR